MGAIISDDPDRTVCRSPECTAAPTHFFLDGVRMCEKHSQTYCPSLCCLLTQNGIVYRPTLVPSARAIITPGAEIPDEPGMQLAPPPRRRLRRRRAPVEPEPEEIPPSSPPPRRRRRRAPA